MFINIRYLVVSLIAVFLALGLGILIGFQLDSNTVLLEQQAALMTSLDAAFSDLNQTNQLLQAEIDCLQSDLGRNLAFAESMAGHYLTGLLPGLRAAIIETSPCPDCQSLKGTLQLAGAEITGSITFGDQISSAGEAASLAEPCQAIAAAIAERRIGALSPWLEQGLLTLDGSFDFAPDVVIIVTGDDGRGARPALIDQYLISALKNTAVRLVAVESGANQRSCLGAYQKERISTVDNVDTIIGQTSLALVLSGLEGHYGIKASAGALLPAGSLERPR